MKRLFGNFREVCLVAPLSGFLIFSGGCRHPGQSDAAQEQRARADMMMDQVRTDAQAELAEAPVEQVAAESIEVPGEDSLLTHGRFDAESELIQVPLRDLWAASLVYSPQIRVFSDLPLIRLTGIQEAKGFFDPRLYAEGSYADRDDPVGSTLTTEESDRFYETERLFHAGIDSKLVTGTEVYIRQEFNRVGNNSEFTIPNPQWKSRSVAGVVQPLLRGAGTGYNKGLMAVAGLDAEIAQLEFERQVQAHLVEISRSYWSLYMARGMSAAKRRGVEGAESILSELESRGGLDARQLEIQRARAYASERRASLLRSETAVLNATERLKTLVNEPNLMAKDELEMVPSDLPELSYSPPAMKQALLVALENRSEILQAYKQLESSVIRRELSARERLPALNAFAEAYLSGLSDEEYEEAWDDQLEHGPGYLVGVRFEMPLGNRSARAVNERRRLEQRQLESQLQTTMETVLLDMRISLREVETSFREVKATYDSVLAAREDLGSLESRKKANLLGERGDAVTDLTLILSAQERLMNAEESFLRAVATYNVSLDSLARAKGTLLKENGILQTELEVQEDEERLFSEDRDLPKYQMRMEDPEASSAE